MRKRLSTGERWLLVSPLAIFLFAGLFFIWKRSFTSETISTAAPVVVAHFLSDDRVLFVTQPPGRGNTTFPSVAIHDLANGQQSNPQVLPAQIDAWSSEISNDGKYWSVIESNNRSGDSRRVIRELPQLKVIPTSPEIIARPGLWRFPVAFKAPAKALQPRDENYWKQRSSRESGIWNISPDRKWGTIYIRGRTVEVPDGQFNDEPRERRFIEGTHVVVSLPDGKKRIKLAGQPWKALCWSKDSQELQGVVHIGEGHPARLDILRFNLETQRTTATRLEIDEDRLNTNVAYMEFRFSPDRRILAAGIIGGQTAFWDASNGRLLKVIASPDSTRRGPALLPQFSPNGDRVLILTAEGVEILRTEQLLPRRSPAS